MGIKEGGVLVLTTLPADADGEGFGRILVEERLAACVHVHSRGRSVYRWQEGIEVEQEQSVTIKTVADRLARVEARIVELHPYNEPEIIVVDVVGGSASYLAWLECSTRPHPSA